MATKPNETKTKEVKTTKPVAKKKTAASTNKTAAPATKKVEKTAAKETAKTVDKAQAAKKAPAKKYHIAQRSEDNMWQVKAEGAEKALKLFKTQQEAIDYAKKVADNQEGSIMIHKKDGSFRKLTY